MNRPSAHAAAVPPRRSGRLGRGRIPQVGVAHAVHDVRVVQGDLHGAAHHIVAALHAQLDACLLLVDVHGLDPAALDSRGRSALTHYGARFDDNDPEHPPANAGPDWRPRLTAEQKAEAVAQLKQARAEHLDRVRREANWQRRRDFACSLVAAGLLPSAALRAEQQAAQALVDTAAAIPPIPRGTEEENKAYLFHAVYSEEGITRRVSSFL